MLKTFFIFLNNVTLIRYFVAGLSVMFFEYVLSLFLNYVGLFYLNATIFSAAVAVCVQFIVHKFYSFRKHSKNQIKKEFLLFIINWLFCLLEKSITVSVLTGVIGLHYSISQLVGISFAALSSFLIYKYIIFVHNKEYENFSDHPKS